MSEEINDLNVQLCVQRNRERHEILLSTDWADNSLGTAIDIVHGIFGIGYNFGFVNEGCNSVIILDGVSYLVYKEVDGTYGILKLEEVEEEIDWYDL